jgi:RNA polymerase sigma-70 factor (ECF subfamily)
MHDLEQRREPDAASDRFERLFRSHHAAVVAYVRRRAHADVVDDVVDETFLVAWRRLDRVPREELPWLLGVARNVLATQHRGARRRRSLASRLAGAGVETTSFDVAAGAGGPVLAALARLAPKDREALTLVAWEGLAPHQAAQVLGEAPGTFRVRLHRARTRMKRSLEASARSPRPGPELRPRAIEETAHD